MSWTKKKQTEALLAANKHHGEWDKENLRVLLNDFPDIDLELTGFELPELNIMGIDFSFESPFESDEAYLANEEKGQLEIDTERFPSNTVYEKQPDPIIPEVKEINPIEHVADQVLNAFEEVEEKTTVDGKRIVLIIDCPSDEVKQALKKKLKPLVEEAECRFF